MTEPAAPPPPPSGPSKDANQWAMLIHLSVLAGFIVPVLGLAVPIGIWLYYRERYPSLTPHAYVVFNWLLSLLIYSAICLVLTLILIGALGFLILGVLTVAYAIIGAIKASEGELWEYPGSFRFLK